MPMLIETSLSFDPDAKSFATRGEALAEGVKRLVRDGDGWTIPQATYALDRGTRCLFADDGDDHVIQITE